MALFKKKRQPIEPLHIDGSVGTDASLVQDNVAGPDTPDFEAIESAEAARGEQRYLGRSGGVRGFGMLQRGGLLIPGNKGQTLDENSLFPTPRPEKDPSDD
jgi:hypothetical protein